MNSILLQALQQAKVLELHYHGYSRIVEPHAYGRDKNGDEILRCYQTSGGSESGERVGWKLLGIPGTAYLIIPTKKFCGQAADVCFSYPHVFV